jgi:hypothetical protein
MPVGVAGWLCTWAALWLPVVEGYGSARQAELQFVGSSCVRRHQVAGARGGDLLSQPYTHSRVVGAEPVSTAWGAFFTVMPMTGRPRSGS